MFAVCKFWSLLSANLSPDLRGTGPTIGCIAIIESRRYCVGRACLAYGLTARCHVNAVE